MHLDPIFWRENWTPAPRDQARRDLAAAIAGDRWILEGNFLPEEEDGWDARFQRADTVVFLDVPRARCVWRVLTRAARDRNRARPDLPEGSREGADLELVRWVWRYPQDERPRVLALLARLEGVAVHHLRSNDDVRRFLGAARERTAP